MGRNKKLIDARERESVPPPSVVFQPRPQDVFAGSGSTEVAFFCALRQNAAPRLSLDKLAVIGMRAVVADKLAVIGLGRVVVGENRAAHGRVKHTFIRESCFTDPYDYDVGSVSGFVADDFVTDDDLEPRVIAELQELEAHDRSAEAVERVLTVLEALLREGDLDEADEIIAALDPSRLSPSVTLAALSITWHARDELKFRSGLVRRAEGEFIRTLGRVRTEALLSSRR